nr:MAG TPA: repressor protein [Bacteriophage sp.]
MLYDNVKILCAEKNISVGQLEKELGFSNGSICKWNENEPGIRKVQKVADYLQVPIEDLLKDPIPTAQ